MRYDDLEKTQDLFATSDVPSPIENIEMEGAAKEEVTASKTETSQPKARAPKSKKSSKLPSKKQLIIIGSIIGGILLLIIVLILLFKPKANEDNQPSENEEPVVVEKDNYTYNNGQLILLNSNSEELGTYTCNNASEELCYVANYSLEDEFDREKNVYDNNQELEKPSQIYRNNYVFIYDNASSNEDNIYLYNILEAKVEDTYTLIKGFNDSDYVILKDNKGKYGAIEFNDNGYTKKIDFEFSYLGRLNKDSNILARANKQYYIYDIDGKALSKGLNYDIKSYNDKYIAIYSAGYFLYDYDSELVIDDAYDYIELLKDYVLLVKDKKLLIRDNDNNKYNEEGITLRDTNYNRLNVYSSDKKLIETKKAYDFEVINNQININVYNGGNATTKHLNGAEKDASAKLSYLNYFDGKLYFYEDEQKQNLLGSYTCNNHNVIDKDNLDLVNCRVASESFYSQNEVEVDNSYSLGWIPIYNNRYVFILDTIDVNSPSISLYDLKNSKVLSKYASVDAGAYTNDDKVTFVQTTNSYIMAKTLTKSKYGVLNIKQDEVVGTKITFDYEKLEKIKDYYLGKDNAGTYVLLDPKEGEKSSKYGYKIVDYLNDYVKVINDGKYYVYDLDGDKVDDTAYLDISLEDDFYIVITNDYKLNIHEYRFPFFGLSEDIEVNPASYKDDYEVTFKNNIYTVKIKSTDSIYQFNSSGRLID